MLVNGFTRQEVSELTGVTIHRLQYLDRTGLIVGSRVGSSRKPVLLYSWNQVLQVLYVRDCKDYLDDNDLKMALEKLNELIGYKHCLVKFEIIYKDKKLHRFVWLHQDDSRFNVFEVMKSIQEEKFEPGEVFEMGEFDLSNLTILKPVRDYVNEVVKAAKASKTIDYQDFLVRSGLIEQSDVSDLIAA